MHGGPHTMNRDSWSYRWNTQVFAAAGYVVTWVNRHGSTGFGETLLAEHPQRVGREAVRRHHEVAPTTCSRSTKNLDPERLAAAGASYGGYMAAWMLGHTDRFKAIIDHAGVNNSYSPVRHRRAARLRQGDGRHAVGERRGPAAQQPDVLREEASRRRRW